MANITDKPIGLNKFERIQLVRNLGLNAPDSILIKSEKEWEERKDWLEKLSHYTVRTLKPDGSRGVDPYFAIIKAEEFAPHRKQFFDEGRHIIISPGVNPKDSLFAGTILREGANTELDIVIGPYGVPRMVTHDGRIDKRIIVKSGESSGDQYIDEMIKKLHSVEEKHQPLQEKTVIYEFSYYQPKVGHLDENAIFWEITGYNRMDDLGTYLESLVKSE